MTAEQFAELAERVQGPVLTPDDAGYEKEVAAHNLAIVNTPPVVVGATSTQDVAATVAFAAEQGSKVTVLSTGHGAYAPVTEGILLNVRRLDGVDVDPENRVARIGGGAIAGDLIAAAAPHGLAPILGSSATVGVVGYLMGGGLGPLVRSHGFSSDYVRAVTIVVASGEVVRADAEQNTDLLWAVRGGKTGLGVVTELELELAEIPSLYAGGLFFEAEDIETALNGWIDWVPSADENVTSSALVIHFPPFEMVPPPLRGRTLLHVRFAYPGDVSRGEELAAPLRELAPVYMDMLGEMPLGEVARIHNDPPDAGPSWVSGMLLDRIDADFAAALLEVVGPQVEEPTFFAGEVRHIAGRSGSDVPEGSAVGGRGAAFTMNFIAADPSRFAAAPATFDEILAKLGPWMSEQTNINFAGPKRSAEHYASAWPEETFARLNEIRSERDPGGVFAAS
ncbi:FAD-binding oxidoreductase [Thermoleophilia bacterium SCSIO 60948]|nr:FAD-binding oxidoreductase [Thermoleophilia bacterium SCSIO 60948]